MEISRLPRVEAWWPSRSQASEQQSDAGTDPGHSCRSQGSLRQPAHGARAALEGLAGQQGTGGATDARARPPCPPQATLQGDDGFEAWPAGGRQPACPKLYADGTESGLDLGITYLWTDEGWLYLVIVLDLFNREVVGWSLKPRMTSQLVTEALAMAWFKKRPDAGLLHHSDRGSQYASHDVQDRLKAYGMTCSMSRKGSCWDNAPTQKLVQQLQE